MINHPTQDPPRCPKCGSEMIEVGAPINAEGVRERMLVCADKKGLHRVRELESQVSELSRQLEEAKGSAAHWEKQCGYSTNHAAKCADERDALQAQLAEKEKPCEWTSDNWETSCGRSGMERINFCPGCGHPVVIKDEPQDAAKEE